MSDTPRTDELFFPYGRDHTAAAEPSLLVCMTQYELLERELAALRLNLSVTMEELGEMRDRAEKAEAENAALRKDDWNGTTHYAGCIQAGPKHYECALQEIGRLRGTIMDLRVKLEAADNRNTAMMKMGDRLIAEREVAAKAEYERGFDDGFILRKEKDKGTKSEYICTCGIRVTPHKCPTDNDF